MTNSFLQAQQQAAATNYVATTPDMVKGKSERQDEMAKTMSNYYKNLVDTSNFINDPKRQPYNDILKITTGGYAIGKIANGIIEARKEIAEWYIPGQDDVRSRLIDAEDDADLNYAEGYTLAGDLERQGDQNSELVHSLKSGTWPRISKKTQLKFALDQWPIFLEEQQDRYQHEVAPGKWITYKAAETVEERFLVLKGMQELYNSRFYEEGSPFGRGLLRKHLLKPQVEKNKALLKEWVTTTTTAQKELATEKRGEGLVDDVLTEVEGGGSGGAALEKYIKTYYGYHERNWKIARSEAFGFLEEAVEKGDLDTEDVISIGEHEFLANDGSIKTIGKYWKKDYKDLHKKAINARSEAANLKKKQQTTLETEFENDNKEKLLNSKTPVTEDLLFNLQKDHISRFGTRARWIDNWISSQDEDDLEIDRRLEIRYAKGEGIANADLVGISDANMLEKWQRRVKEGGVDQKTSQNITEWIKGHVNAHTNETDGDKVKTPKWINVKQQAEEDFWNIYRKAKSTGVPDRVALSEAEQAVKKSIYAGEYDVRQIYSRDEEASNNLLEVKEALLKDTNLINSTEPWIGEEQHLKAGLEYLTLGKGTIPRYYYNFPHIKIAPYELMRHRLIQTGTLKGSDLNQVPERKLDPVHQDKLLYKPNPSSTYEVIGDDSVDTEELIDYSNYDDSIALNTALRNEIARRNSATGVSVAWMEPVEIDQGLLEELKGEVGELPFGMQPQNMPREIAKAFVSDILEV